jgi:hypothetical protein
MNKMELSSNINKSFKKYNYSIITAIIIAFLTCGYLYYILPHNKAKEDAKNIAVLEGIEKQLKAYIDDQVKYISARKIVNLNLSRFNGSTDVYINNITINKDKSNQLEDGKIKISRLIYLSTTSKKFGKTLKKKDTIIKDSINIDLVKFLNKINSTTQFTSFYICPIENGECLVHKPLLSKNINPVDQDSLIHNNRKNGPFSFKESTKHYYTDQIKIPRTNYSLFLAAGIDISSFQTSVRQIDTNILIFSLLLVIILILGINFIKPIISSYKERLSQFDLVGVAFSIGVLIAILVIFGALAYWNNAVKTRNTTDLKQLVNRIDNSFTEQITAYQNWKNEDSILGTEWENSKNTFAKIYLKTGSKITSLNRKAPTKKDSLLPDVQKKDIDISNLKKNKKDSTKFEYLDSYFRMDNRGLLTTNLSTTFPDMRRRYADRMYFKMLQQKNIDNQNTDKNIDALLTAVFSREDNKYQWVYVEKNFHNEENNDIKSIPFIRNLTAVFSIKGIKWKYDKKNKDSESNGIKGIGFREYFSEEIILPPGTGYMLIDRHGDVLMQNNPEKNLYQNLLYGSQNKLELVNLLSGINPASFEMEYQGIPYQIYAKKLNTKSDSPVYILGVRNLSHLNRLAMFTFSNGFLISVFYGFFILVITYIYSILFYGDRISLFSNHHFYHLFPDNSRTYQYKQLLIVNSIAILLTIIVSLLSTPSIAFITCTIVGVNLVLINLITLNIRTLSPKRELIKLVVILFFLGICLPLILFFYDNLALAIFVLFSTHASSIFYYRNWRKGPTENLKQFKKQNKGVNRKSYTRFLTARLLYHFVVFPFILISAFYVNELNDFARYYCSSNQGKEQSKDFITNAYSCNCNENKEQPLIVPNSKDDVVQKANVGFLDRPATFEIKNFTFNALSNKYYLNSKAMLQNESMYQSFWIAFSLFIGLFFLAILVYHLLNYYSNHFFFYDLMQAAYKKYYPGTKNPLANKHIFIPMVNNTDIKNLVQVSNNEDIISDTINQDTEEYPKRINIKKVFKSDKKNEISPFLRMDFIVNYNNTQFADEYNDIWDSLPNEETQYVLFDFAQDHFVNYKNKDVLMSLMESGIIDCHQLTGRLKMMSLSFRIFILSKSERDETFITKFKDESKNGTFSKLKFPILIVAISALVLLMYLNKDSYDRVAVMGGSIVSVLALINKFLEANKSI